MASTIRYGIVGTGMMGLEHLRNIDLLPDAELVAIADPTPASLGWARDALGGQEAAACDSVDAFAHAVRVDAVAVVSPNHTHRAVLDPLFAADAAILCASIARAAWT